MSNFGVSLSAIQFSSGQLQQAAADFSNYLDSVAAEERQEFGQYLLDLSSEDARGSPLAEFTNEALHWTGQSIVDGEWNSSPLDITSLAFAAAVVEFGTDALIGAALAAGLRRRSEHWSEA